MGGGLLVTMTMVPVAMGVVTMSGGGGVPSETSQWRGPDYSCRWDKEGREGGRDGVCVCVCVCERR